MPAAIGNKQDEEVDTVIVNNIIPFIEDDEPACVAFPNLVATASVANAEALNGMKMRPIKRKKKEGAMGAEDEEWEMIGSSGGKEWLGRRGFEELNVDYFIGIRNKKSRTVKFIEVDRSFSLRPSLCPGQWKETEAKGGKDEKRTYVEQKQDLLAAFGGKKSIQRIARYERDKITEDKLDEHAAAHATAAAAKMKERDAEEGINQVAQLTTELVAPPHDNNATRPQDAYPLEGLTTPRELTWLESEAQKIIDGMKHPETFENPGWHKLVWQLLRHTAVMTDIPDEEKRNRLKAGVYLHYLMVLARASQKFDFGTQRQAMTDMGVFPPILGCLLERFTIPDPRGKSKSNVRIRRREDLTRILEYAMIMWITLLGFADCRRLGEVAEGLGVHELKTLLKLATSVGCKVKKSRGQLGPEAYSLSLRVPLKFPLVKKRMGKPQRRR